MIKLKLFIEFFKIGALAFGGGFSTLPFINKLANKTNWITQSEVNQMLTISQVTPGPLACNMATYVGFKVNGISRCSCSNDCFCYTSNFVNVSYK